MTIPTSNSGNFVKNSSSISEKIDELSRHGYTKERIQELYDSGMSKNDLISEINSSFDITIVSKNSFRKIWNELHLVSRSPADDTTLRMRKVNSAQRENNRTLPVYGRGISADEAVSHYQEGLSLAQMYHEYGISPVVLSRLLKERGIEVRHQRTLDEIVRNCQQHGLDRDEIDRLYNVENISFRELLKNIEERTGEKLSEITAQKLLHRLGIRRTAENTTRNRGLRSRETFENSCHRLERTPHKNLQELAEYFYCHKNLTYNDLLDELNSCLEPDEETFTLSWLEHRMMPLLPSDRDIGTSRLERSVISYIRSIYSGSLLERDRTVIRPQEVDIYLPSLHLAVEVNGLYWHSEKFGKDKNYHKDKYEACKKAGVRLVQIWEDDWNNRRRIVESFLAHVIGVDRRPSIGARKTYIDEISVNDSKNFLNSHHIQGFVNATIHLGLRARNDDRLVAVLSVTEEKKSAWNIVRYATSENVQGGFSKLLTYFEKRYHPSTEKTFSNRETSEGDLYRSTGFLVDAVLPPDYMYVFHDRREHKFNFRKKRFRTRSDLLYRNDLTERGLADLNGLNRVYDSGKVRWVRRLPERHSLENEIQELPQCSTRFKETDHEIPHQS